jgi:hypothetical protein
MAALFVPQIAPPRRGRGEVLFTLLPTHRSGSRGYMLKASAAAHRVTGKTMRPLRTALAVAEHNRWTPKSFRRQRGVKSNRPSVAHRPACVFRAIFDEIAHAGRGLTSSSRQRT